MESLQEKINRLFKEAGVDNPQLAGHVYNAAVAFYRDDEPSVNPVSEPAAKPKTGGKSKSAKPTADTGSNDGGAGK